MILEGIGELQQRFPFTMVIFDFGLRQRFINHMAAWPQALDVEQT